MAIDGIAGISLFTTPDRFEAMRSFYTDVLGLTPDAPRAGSTAEVQRAAFTWGHPPDRLRLILSTHDGVAGPSAEPHRVMINLLTHDLEAHARGMSERGAEFLHGPVAMSWGGRMATFRDPDGNTLQLLQPAEA